MTHPAAPAPASERQTLLAADGYAIAATRYRPQQPQARRPFELAADHPGTMGLAVGDAIEVGWRNEDMRIFR